MSYLQQKNSSSQGLPLVPLRVYEPFSNDGASSVSVNQFSVDDDGIIDQKPDSSDSRVFRYQRQSIARRLLPDNRVSKCLRVRVDASRGVDVLKSSEHGKCHFSNLISCGSVWDCPVCAAKITERRRLELISAVDQQVALGGSVLLFTFTYPHKREDNLSDLLKKQAKAMEWFYRHKTYKNIKAKYQKKGRVRALEVNHGDANGWHPHIHELWFLDLCLNSYESLKMEVCPLWVKACLKFGLGAPSWEHGLDIRGGDQAAKYVSKFGLEEKKDDSKKGWGIESELTKAHLKKGRNGSRSPFQLLDDYIDGDKRAGALFIEYSQSFYRKKQLNWSRGLKAQFNLDDISDKALAEREEDKAYLLATIEPEHWKIIKMMSTPRYDQRIIVLTLAENGGAEVMQAYIVGLVERFQQMH